jgi:hypothetical protein
LEAIQTMRRPALVALLAIIAILAACSDESGSTASADATESAAPSEAAQSESAEPSESTDASMGALPSFDLNGDPELAARFPDTVGGETLTTFSMRGDNPMFSAQSDPSFDAFLDNLGAELSDVSVAFGSTASAEPFTVAAFRVAGANQDQLEQEFVAATEASGEATGFTEVSLGGKTVLSAEEATMGTILIYAKDDTIYWMSGTTEQAEEVLAVLP